MLEFKTKSLVLFFLLKVQLLRLARTQSYNKQLLKEIGRLLVAAEHEQRSLKEDRSSHLETHCHKWGDCKNTLCDS